MPTIRLGNGLDLFYRECGEGERVLLLIHGNLASSRWWERVMAHLPAGVRAVAPDLRCCGQSGSWDGAWSMADLAGDIHAFARGLQLPRATVVGHSLGGGVALQLAADHPEDVERLVLINTAAIDGLRLPPEAYAQVEIFAQSPEVTRQALAMMVPTAPRDEFLTALFDDAAQRGRFAWVRNGYALRAMDLTDRAQVITVPTLIVYGAKDNLVTRQMMERTRDAIAGAVLEVWDEVGHSAPAEAPVRLARRIAAFAGVGD